MVAAGSIIVLIGVVALVVGITVLARRRTRSRRWPQLLVIAAALAVLAGLLLRSSGRHADVCSYDSHRCAVPQTPPSR